MDRGLQKESCANCGCVVSQTKWLRLVSKGEEGEWRPMAGMWTKELWGRRELCRELRTLEERRPNDRETSNLWSHQQHWCLSREAVSKPIRSIWMEWGAIDTRHRRNLRWSQLWKLIQIMNSLCITNTARVEQCKYSIISWTLILHMGTIYRAMQIQYYFMNTNTAHGYYI